MAFQIDWEDPWEQVEEEVELPQPIKRRKLGTISELAKKSFSDETLLETLRNVKHAYEPETEEETQKLMDLILKHASGFPPKMRPSIAAGKVEAEALGEDSEETPSKHFYTHVCDQLADFLSGFPLRSNFKSKRKFVVACDDGEWYGPDNKVDTEDQIELAIRLVPDVYRLIRSTEENNVSFLERMALRVEAISFLPLIIDMHPQFPDRVFNLFNTLLNNTECHSDELDEKGFDALQRIVNKHDVPSDDLRKIFVTFLSETVLTSKTFSFIEKRIRLLIACDPAMLRVGDDEDEDEDSCVSLIADSSSSLIAAFKKINEQRIRHLSAIRVMQEERRTGREAASREVHEQRIREERKSEPLDIRLFKLVMELGVLHFPNEVLGFVLEEKNLKLSWELFGMEAVNREIKDKIASTKAEQENKNRKKSLLMDWILKAAGDDLIALDGFHTLIRFDPSVLVSNRGTK